MSPSKKKQAELREEKDWERIDSAVYKSESFIEKYQKQLLIAIGVMVLIACCYIGYKNFIIKPKAKEAEIAMFKGEEYYRNGQDSLAVYGDNNGYVGFETISNEYSSTQPGKLAKLYAGICYANMGQYEKAIKYLEGFSSGDLIMSQLVNATIGDCLVNTNQPEKAIPYYTKAAKGVDNEVQSPIIYKKLGILYRDMGKYDDVIETFTTIKNRYGNTQYAFEADKYIEEAKILKEGK